jgi:halimadienyl-diphosphate synthase
VHHVLAHNWSHSLSRQADVTTAPLLGDPLHRPGIAGTAYDTAWLAGVAAPESEHGSHFPTALQWLVEHQHPDGSWGGVVRYEHDRVVSTLAALPALATFGRRTSDRASVRRGVRYLWQNGHLLAGEPVELVGFELLLPALVDRARAVGVPVPPHLDIYAEQRRHKLSLLPPSAIYSATSTAAHSLEFLGASADLAGLRAAQGANGSLGNSPAATAFYYARSADERALAYLQACLRHSGGGTAPVLHPCERFELLWAAYHLWLAGVPAFALLSQAERSMLRDALAHGGVSLGESFPIPDADDTAVALLLLHAAGEPVDASVLERFRLPDGTYAAFPYERHSSVGVNVHVLHAAAVLPTFPERERTITRLLDYLAAEQHGRLYWIDKWHISPYYATAHTLRVLDELPSAYTHAVQPLRARAREWLCQTQNLDGTWGFYGQPTAEETAYAVLALASGPDALAGRDRGHCAAGLRALTAQHSEAPYPALWIDKCLYTPTLVVQAVLAAARVACGQGLAARHRWRLTG